MPDAVIVALITGACAVIAQLIISHTSNVKMLDEIERKSEASDLKLQGKIDVMNTTIEELTREVRAHNNFAQRMPVLEEKVKQLEGRTQ
jgi:hypothetical protein